MGTKALTTNSQIFKYTQYIEATQVMHAEVNIEVSTKEQ